MASSENTSAENETFLSNAEKKNKSKMDRLFASSVRDLKAPSFYRALLAETIGVIFLVFVACSSPFGGGGPVADLETTRISFGFGLSVATMVWCLANTSGAHINPAVTVGMFITRKTSLIRFITYIIFQCIGGIIGSALHESLTCEWQVEYMFEKTGRNTTCSSGLTNLSESVSAGQGIVIEMLITFVLVFTVFATCDGSRSDLKGSGPLAIGLSVTMCHLAAVPMTGASMNPARTFGPAVISGLWTNHYVYWVGPMLGGIIAALLYEFVFAGNASVKKFLSWLKDTDYERPSAVVDDDSHEYPLKPTTVETKNA